MSAPERIHCNWNAADAADAFYNAGVELGGFFQKTATSEQIVEVLAKRLGIFRLLGRVATTNEEVTLKILHAVKEHNLIKVETTFGPVFSGDYSVTNEPSPLVTMHGDLLFDLTKIIS
jgi:uncharacterized membrane protein